MRAVSLLALLLLTTAAVAEPPKPAKLPPLPPPDKAPAAKAAPLPAPAAKPEAKPDARPEPKKADPAQVELLTNLLRDQMKDKIPDPLTQSSHNWGKQVAVTVVRRQGLRFRPEPVGEEMVNHGLWRHVEVRIPDPSKVALAITELTYPEEGKMLATVAVACERVDAKMEHQLWRNGRRLYGGETRVHLPAGITLKAEVTTKNEPNKGGILALPEVTLTIKVTDAELSIGKIVVDRTVGLDGPAAEAVGDLALNAIKSVKPDLEADLLKKANAAIVKAAGTREVKVALDKLLETKPKK